MQSGRRGARWTRRNGDSGIARLPELMTTRLSWPVRSHGAQAATATDHEAAMEVSRTRRSPAMTFSSHRRHRRPRQAPRSAAADAGKATSPATVSYLAFADTFSRWTREHPSARMRQRIARERSNAEVRIEQTARFAMDLRRRLRAEDGGAAAARRFRRRASRSVQRSTR
jgi:hypothetical protein